MIASEIVPASQQPVHLTERRREFHPEPLFGFIERRIVVPVPRAERPRRPVSGERLDETPAGAPVLSEGGQVG